jgi:hypothetical protein
VLTKSKYLTGLQCAKRLWIEEAAPHLLGPASPVLAHLRSQGIEVGTLARGAYPAGHLVTSTGRAALAETAAAIDAGATALFEAAFEAGGVYVRCDILVRRGDGAWDLVEVKSTTRVKQMHIHDLAVQLWVLTGAGLTVAAAKVLHINNRAAVYPHLEGLFVEADVTRQVQRALRGVPAKVAALERTLHLRHAPRVGIGPHCQIPHPCPAIGHCWAHVPRHSIFTIPRITPERVRELLKLGVLHVQEIPPDFPLTAGQWAYVRRALSGKAEIAVDRIAARLRRLVYPIHFLDFETYAYAVPRFAGMRAYQQLPFQYSLHVLHADGTLTHTEYLHRGCDDPRPALAAQLAQAIGPTGSVVAYHASFERGVLLDLGRTLPAMRKALWSAAFRLWDQLEVFRHDYLDPEFEGSNSIKRVLPVLAPGMTYDDLAVRRGDQAQAIWQALIRCDDAEQRDRLGAELTAYCERDTLAMVAIHRALTRLVDASAQSGTDS